MYMEALIDCTAVRGLTSVISHYKHHGGYSSLRHLLRYCAAVFYYDLVITPGPSAVCNCE